MRGNHMSERRPIPFRQVHLDFHTSPHIKDVGAEFDPEEFALMMERARVNSVNVFAKCHHGHLYYKTSRPERHPGLKPGLDLTGAQVEALHRHGIAAPIYISIQCDEYAANAHPDWVAREPDGRPVGAGPLSPGWQILDMSSPYQEYVAEQIQEVLDIYSPVDGIWFDMCWDQPSCSRYAIEGMLRSGLNPESPDDRAAYARNVARAYMRRFHAMVKASSPNALVFFNCRPFAYLPDEISCFEQIEIEALPTGGWGYLYFPKNVRFVRTFGKPYLGMTARFHKSWGDFGGLKPYAALEYETAQMVAHGARCCIGDQLHPRGALDQAVYDLIGCVYSRIEEREPWLEGAEAVTQIGVIHGPPLPAAQMSGVEEGLTRMLTQLKHQFDFVHPAGDWQRYELVILPDCVEVDARFALELEEYLATGGRVLASGSSGLSEDGSELILRSLGIRPHGTSPFSTTYIRLEPTISTGVPAMDHVMYERGMRVTPLEGTQTLARVVEPYFERSWSHFSSHRQTPPDAPSPYAAVTRRRGAAYIAYPIFSAFGKHGNAYMRLLVRNVLDLLLPRPLLKVDAPTSTEATVTIQPGRIIVHLLHYCPERRAADLDLVEDTVPIRDVPLSLKLDGPPSRVYVALGQDSLPFTYVDGYARVVVPEVRGHAMVVFELER